MVAVSTLYPQAQDYIAAWQQSAKRVGKDIPARADIRADLFGPMLSSMMISDVDHVAKTTIVRYAGSKVEAALGADPRKLPTSTYMHNPNVSSQHYETIEFLLEQQVGLLVHGRVLREGQGRVYLSQLRMPLRNGDDDCVLSLFSSRKLAAEPGRQNKRAELILDRFDVIDIGFGDIELPPFLRP